MLLAFEGTATASGVKPAPVEVRKASHYVFSAERAYGELAELWCERGDEQRRVFAFVTPEQNRAVLEDLWIARKDHFVTRLDDLGSGWWVEVATPMGLKGLRGEDWGEVLFRRMVEENPRLGLSLRTSDGYFEEAHGDALEGSDLGLVVVERLMAEKGFVESIPPAVWEELAFLRSLDAKEQTTVGNAGLQLLAILDQIRERLPEDSLARAVSYANVHWDRRGLLFLLEHDDDLLLERGDDPRGVSFRELTKRFPKLPGCARTWQ